MNMPQKGIHYLGHFYGKKVKYDYAFKLKCVELVLKQHFTDGYVSKLKQIPRYSSENHKEIKTVFNIIDNEKHLLVFIILQELMNNSLRYGKVSIISIIFEKKDEVDWCFYTGDRISFEMKSDENKKSLGMRYIESRIAFLNGKMNLESSIIKEF